ncbi:MAG: hypothetical protein J6C62_06385 [Clostridia bacterium]|nr:hypothetical protein [Clostridia bacterium]
MMMTKVYVEKNTGNDRQAIQNAIELAVKENIGTVVLDGGEWHVDKTCYLYDSLHFVIDGATVYYDGKDDNILFANINGPSGVGHMIEYTQKNIVLSGKNNAKIVGGCVLFTNITYSVIEGLNFYDVDNFAIILASTLAIKVRNSTFNNCTNAIALGVGTRDCFFYDLSGQVKQNFFVMGDYLYEQYRRVHRYHVVLNILIRNIKAKASTVALLYGRNIQRVVFSDIEAQVDRVAFDVRKGKHVCLSGLKITGKVLNDDVAENSVCFVDEN